MADFTVNEMLAMQKNYRKNIRINGKRLPRMRESISYCG